MDNKFTYFVENHFTAAVRFGNDLIVLHLLRWQQKQKSFTEKMSHTTNFERVWCERMKKNWISLFHTFSPEFTHQFFLLCFCSVAIYFFYRSEKGFELTRTSPRTPRTIRLVLQSRCIYVRAEAKK